MTIGFSNPYFDGLGGGERYTLSLASHWSHAHDVRIFWDDASLMDKAQQRFNIDLSRVRLTQNIFRGKNIFKKALLSRQYDLIYFLTDGSIPTSLARHAILHFQVPFSHIQAPDWKLNRFSAIVCNSRFTKEHLDSRVAGRADVIYPPVDTSLFKTGRKELMILSVGRFSSSFQPKKQEMLINSFAKFIHRNHFSQWKLVLAGGLLPSDQLYFADLKKRAYGLPIELVTNISFEDLRNLYGKAMIYWHAAGYGETDPTKMEHFGISTVEAMASGCIPIVYNGGGLPEIVTEGNTGFFWKTESELLDKTFKAATDGASAKAMIHRAQEKSRVFDTRVFCQAYDKILSRLSI